MAAFVLMLKEFENEDRVVYQYGPNENSMGRIEYDKKIGLSISFHQLIHKSLLMISSLREQEDVFRE
ncbi:hypothetical protein PVA17_23535 [Lysinibacillus sp. CNPSo 3705]|uniref:hypothetical protein n=1 Tax=Lysinibacillus sp. CNPSo 3705 TaxID=3028148 RepID=UPI002363B76A|nr:hypothetical protein [Lysinibacillus sp. CNPSo 3705]MDD1505698.1 hypothetical protein [Lysinibacillus sp. CNPSo 3705]